MPSRVLAGCMFCRRLLGEGDVLRLAQVFSAPAVLPSELVRQDNEVGAGLGQGSRKEAGGAPSEI